MDKKECFDKEQLTYLFNEYGIYLVIESDLPGSKIRGAFKVHKNAPSIYITDKHKRIADIYFALLHELAHCKSDFNKAKKTSLVSFEVDLLEENADKQAFEWMIPECDYQKIIHTPNYQIEMEENYPKSFVVYRMAKDQLLHYSSKEYQDYNILLNRES